MAPRSDPIREVGSGLRPVRGDRASSSVLAPSSDTDARAAGRIRRFDSGGGLAMSRLINETATLLASDPVIWETYSTIIDGRDRHQSGEYR
jgi:hypothetical protein